MKFINVLSILLILVGIQSLNAQSKEEKKLQKLIEKGNLDKARSYCEKVEDKAKYAIYIKCYAILGEAYLENDDCENAIACSRKTKVDDYLELLADRLADKSSPCYDIDKAIELYKDVDNEHPRLAEIYIKEKNNPEKALPYATSRDCDEYGDYLMEMGEVDWALVFYNRYIDDENADPIEFLDKKGVLDYFFLKKEYQKGYDLTKKVVCNAHQMYSAKYPRTPEDKLALHMLLNGESVKEVKIFFENNGLQHHVINIVIVESLLHTEKHNELSKYIYGIDNKKGYFALIDEMEFEENAPQKTFLLSEFKKYNLDPESYSSDFTFISDIMRDVMKISARENDYIARSWKSIGTKELYDKASRIKKMKGSRKLKYIKRYNSSFGNNIKAHLKYQKEIAAKLPPNVSRLLLHQLARVSDTEKRNLAVTAIVQLSLATCYENTRQLAVPANPWAFNNTITMLTATASKVDLIKKLYKMYAFQKLVNDNQMQRNGDYMEAKNEMSDALHRLERIATRDIVDGRFNTTIKVMNKADLKAIKAVQDANVAAVKSILIYADAELAKYKEKVEENDPEKDKYEEALSKLDPELKSIMSDFDKLQKSKRGDYFNKWEKQDLGSITARAMQLPNDYIQ